MTPSRHRPTTTATGTMLTLLAAFVSLSLTLSRSSPSSIAEPPPATAFAVLSAVRSTSDRLPSEVAASLTVSTEPEFTPTDLRAARRILPDTPTWLVPTDEDLCLVRMVYPISAAAATDPPTTTRSCASVEDTEAGHLVTVQSLLTSGAQTEYARVVGVAPDRFSSALIVLRSGARVRRAIVHNGYEAVVREPVRVLLIEAGKQTSESIPLATYSASPS